MKTRVTLAGDVTGFAIGAALVAVTPASGQQFQDQTATRFPSLAEYTNYVEVSDIDADGDLDLVFANGGNFSSVGPVQPVRVFVNDGDGLFADESEDRVGISGNFRGVVLGDIDRDGDDDMVLASDFNRRPRILVNDGDGFFTEESSRLPGVTLSATRAQFGDIDNDGDLDIYINDGGEVNRFGCGQNRIYINDGTGFFTDETDARHPLGNVCEPMDAIFGDIDNDFDLDVRTGNRGSNNSKLYRNDGTGVFTDISGGVPGDSACYSYDMGDINGDGNLDMIGANAGPSNQEMLLRGDGTGAFVNVSGQISPNGSGDDNDSKFFDLDNDGDLDLIVAALFQPREKIFINNGSGAFTQDTSIITSINDNTLDVMVADFDNDDRVDIVTGQGESGSFVNRIYMNVSGPQDTLPPTIVRTEQLESGCIAGPYVVRTTIADGVTSDRGFFDRGVELRYSVNGGPDETVDMAWSGNSLWRAEIPAQAGGSEIAYHVLARDWAGNEGTGETLIFSIAGGADVTGDGIVNVDDLLEVLAAWGPCGADCPDVNCDGAVTVDDLLAVLAAWSE